MRRVNDKLHYYINGEDQGVAADNVESKIWGVVDLYGMTVKVLKLTHLDNIIIILTNVSDLIFSLGPAYETFTRVSASNSVKAHSTNVLL